MIPLYDMLDHKPGHAVQWEATSSSSTSLNNGKHRIRFRCVHAIAKGEPIYNNYGPKGNGELLVTYGFATKDNTILDSVEGIVLGLRIPAAVASTRSKNDKNGNNMDDDSKKPDDVQAGVQEVYKEQMALIQQHLIPHRFEQDGRVLLLGPFSLHRKLLKPDDKEEERTLLEDDETTATANNNSSIVNNHPDNNAPEYSGGVIPESLYHALSIIGMEDAQEGPIISVDELDMLRDVLVKKLNGFGDSSSSLGSSGVAAAVTATEKRAPGHYWRAESVEAYKDGQRGLLQLVLAELDALVPSDSDEE